MDDPIEQARQLKRTARLRLERAAKDAFGRLKRNPGFPEIELQVIQQCESLRNTVGRNLTRPAFPSPERLEYAVRHLDIRAGGYVGLVLTQADHEDFAVLLQDYERKAWEMYRGVVYIEPVAGVNRELKAIEDRSLHWCKESLRRLIRNDSKPVGESDAQGGMETRRSIAPEQKGTGSARSRDKKIVELEAEIREMKAEGLSQKEMCSRLDANKWELPSGARWRHLTWTKAYLSREFGRSVKKWLSKATHQ
jgi:hypothetical protein